MSTTTVVQQSAQVVINVENVSLLPALKKILRVIPGVSIVSKKTRKSGIDLALEDAKAGRVTEWNCSTEEMFKAIIG